MKKIEIHLGSGESYQIDIIAERTIVLDATEHTFKEVIRQDPPREGQKRPAPPPSPKPKSLGRLYTD